VELRLEKSLEKILEIYTTFSETRGRQQDVPIHEGEARGPRKIVGAIRPRF